MVHFAHSESEKDSIRVAQILNALSTTIIKSKKTAELITSRAASYQEKRQKGDLHSPLALFQGDVIVLVSARTELIFFLDIGTGSWYLDLVCDL